MDENPSLNLSTHVVRLIFFGLFAGFFGLIFYGIWALSIPIAISFLLSFLLTPFVDFLEGLGIARILSVVIALCLSILGIYLIITLIVPLVSGDINSIAEQSETIKIKASGMMNEVKILLKEKMPAGVNLDKLDINFLLSIAFTNIKEMSQGLLSIIPDLITYTIITIIMLFIFLLEGYSIYNTLLGMVPNRYFEMTLQIFNKIKISISGYLKGLLIQWTILVAIIGGGFMTIGLSYGPLLGILAATVNLIPYVGPGLGIVPAIVIALLEPDPNIMFKVLMVFGLGQVVDNAYTQPVILAKSVQLHPLLAILSFISFQQLLGIVGMVIAVPVTGILLVAITVMYKSLKAFRII